VVWLFFGYALRALYLKKRAGLAAVSGLRPTRGSPAVAFYRNFHTEHKGGEPGSAYVLPPWP